MSDLKINKHASLRYTTGYGKKETLNIHRVKEAVLSTHTVIDLILKDIPVDIFSILGMRNLSAFIGELFSKSLEEVCKGTFKSNPSQDGYPDLLSMNADGLRDWRALEANGSLREKAPFSPYKNGGLEIKATCGSVPTPKESAKKGMVKPGMGDM